MTLHRNTTATPRVSVIMIFLDAERFIQEALDSLLAQSVQDWELILVDDGSRDASPAAARAFADAYPDRVRLLRHPDGANHGTAASRNLGLAHARGELVTFLDSDDVWVPHKLRDQLAIMEANPGVALVYSIDLYWHGWTGRAEDQRRDHVPGPGASPRGVVDPGVLPPLYLSGRAPIPGVGFLARREAIEAVGGFDHFPSLFEDQALGMKICLSYPVFVAGEPWNQYRRHADSLCAVAERESRERPARLRYLAWLRGYLRDHPGLDRGLGPVVDDAIARCQRPVMHRLRRALREAVGRA